MSFSIFSSVRRSADHPGGRSAPSATVGSSSITVFIQTTCRSAVVPTVIILVVGHLHNRKPPSREVRGCHRRHIRSLIEWPIAIGVRHFLARCHPRSTSHGMSKDPLRDSPTHSTASPTCDYSSETPSIAARSGDPVSRLRGFPAWMDFLMDIYVKSMPARSQTHESERANQPHFSRLASPIVCAQHGRKPNGVQVPCL
ncbi:MAG: hypothetical protein ACI9R3_005727 [Verrucomicrobiales bacterium]|jgi:hypothetical protein